MRKFIVVLILLLLIGGVGFYFGWVQFRLPPGNVGVMFSKTSGWNPTAFRAGEFAWHWEPLLPTNTTLYVLDAQSRTVRVSSSGTLPSGSLYGGMLAGSPTFEYEVRFAVTFRVRAESLPMLLEDGIIDGNDIESWYDSLGRRVETQALDFVAGAMEQATDAPPTERIERVSQSLSDSLSATFDNLEIVSVMPIEISLPDVLLYQRAREMYFAAMEARQEAIEDAMSEASTQEVVEEARLGTLRRYGEVLTEYPVLLDYFGLGAAEGVDPLNLGDLRPEGVPAP